MGKIVKYICDKCGKEIDSLNYTYTAKLDVKNIYAVPEVYDTCETKFLCTGCCKELENYYNKFWKGDK